MKLAHVGQGIDYRQFQKVITDLESRGATVMVVAYVPDSREERIDYTIEARFPSGKVWEITEIKLVDETTK